jgi:hypothetical protein
MSQDESTRTAEDLELDGSDAESIVGGRVTIMRFKSTHAAAEEISRLASQGFMEIACMSHGTLMENPKSGRRIEVKY